MVVSPKGAEGRRTPLPGLSAHLWLQRAQAPHFLLEPIVQRHTFCRVLVDTGAGLHGQFRGKMPELMSMRPRAFRLPGDSIDRARFSAGRAGPL